VLSQVMFQICCAVQHVLVGKGYGRSPLGHISREGGLNLPLLCPSSRTILSLVSASLENVSVSHTVSHLTDYAVLVSTDMF